MRILIAPVGKTGDVDMRISVACYISGYFL